MLWTQIMDFYIRHVFGGIDSLGVEYNGSLGYFRYTGSNETFGVSTAYPVNILHIFIDGNLTWTLGNYLSFIASIITMVAILLFCVFIIKKIIAIIFRLFTGSSAF